MPRITREAEIVWEGSIARGTGVVSGTNSGAFALPTTIASRVSDPQGKTSPEELLAAAHASCYVTSLGGELARAGTPPERLEVHCSLTIDEVEGLGHRVVLSAITARGVVPGSDAAGFAQAAAAADDGCTMSALVRASATVTVDATLEEAG
ncbi:MAG: OsmC family peroxiredoxin [Gaiellaceae bacterium]